MREDTATRPEPTALEHDPLDLDHADKVVRALKLERAADVLKAASDRHYAKSFGEARFLYAVLVRLHPESREAVAATGQLRNLERFEMINPIHRSLRRNSITVSDQPPTSGDGRSAAELLRRAQEQHYAKAFAEARELYAAIIHEHPKSDEAVVAKQQLDNLRDF